MVWVPKYRVPDVAGADWSGSAKMRDDVLSATRMRDRGNECSGRPRALVGQGAADAIDLGVDGRPERTYCDPAVHGVSEFAQEAVLGQSFWAKGYCVDTVGLDSEMIKKYVRFQEKEEQHQEQLQLEPAAGGPSRKGR